MLREGEGAHVPGTKDSQGRGHEGCYETECRSRKDDEGQYVESVYVRNFLWENRLRSSVFPSHDGPCTGPVFI